MQSYTLLKKCYAPISQGLLYTLVYHLNESKKQDGREHEKFRFILSFHTFHACHQKVPEGPGPTSYDEFS